MKKLIVNNDKIDAEKAKELVKLCTFNAIDYNSGVISINAACRMCLQCVKKGPKGCIELYNEEAFEHKIDKSQWSNITVYVDHVDGDIHPVTFELLGKARDLVSVVDQSVNAIMMGYDIYEKSKELLHYGVDKVYVYDHPSLNHFRIEPYTSVFEDFIAKNKPSSILIGATTVGRQLAPRVAARLRTGLTADCTVLEMGKNTDLAQIRPAFGGNIMAQIQTPNNRPQMATVRYKVMNAPLRSDTPQGQIVQCDIDLSQLKSNIEVLSVAPKVKEESIETSEVLIVAGRGLKKQEDLKMIKELADLLNAKIACTRPLIESGWMPAKNQVGLSGRTVRPKLIITCGVSGSIQFVSGMNNSDRIVAINKDPHASIFNVAHYGLVGDIYEIIPQLIRKIKTEKKLAL